MKKWICGSVLIVFSASLLVLAARSKATDNDACSDGTLRGDYAFRISGELFPTGGGPIYRDGVAMTHFDGNGNLTQADYVFGNGILVPGVPDPVSGFHIDETGTYHVNPDCTAKAEIDFPAPPKVSSGAVIKLMMVIAKHGDILHSIVSEVLPPGATSMTPPIPANIHSDAERLRDSGEKE